MSMWGDFVVFDHILPSSVSGLASQIVSVIAQSARLPFHRLDSY